MKFGYKVNKPVLLLAPDAIITLNQSIGLPVCRDCGASSNIIDLVTRLNVNLSVDSNPGTASFDLAIPKHSNSQVYEQGKINIPLMSEVQIFIKGRYLDKDNQPSYYQVFWGLVTSVEFNYSDGFYSVHVSCEDMLKWWSITKILETDSVLNSLNTKGTFRALGNNYSYLTAPEIIYALSLAMFEDIPLVEQAPVGSPDFIRQSIVSQDAVYENALTYWRNRFKSLAASEGKNLKITGLDYNGARSKAIKDAILNKVAISNDSFKVKSRVPLGNRSAESFFQNAVVESLPLYQELSSSTSPMSAGVRTALEIANDVKERINYEFFMDTGGVITFKPPYYNAQSKEFETNGNKIYTISDIDLISYSLSHNLDNIYSRIDIEGSYIRDTNAGGSKPSVFYIDPDRAKLYGIKQQRVSVNFLNNNEALYNYAVAELNRLNCKEYTGSIEIAGRPELKLGMPIFLECENIYLYVKGITHQFDFGQSFTTSLTVEAVRRYSPKSNNGKLQYVTYTAKGLDKAKRDAELKKLLSTKGIESKEIENLFVQFKASNASVKQKNVNEFISSTDAVTMVEFVKFVENKAQTSKSVPISTVATALAPLSNAIKTSEIGFTESLVPNPPSSSNSVYFRKYDKSGYELVLGFAYGFNLDKSKNFDEIFTAPSQIVAAGSPIYGSNLSSKQCTCVPKE